MGDADEKKDYSDLAKVFVSYRNISLAHKLHKEANSQWLTKDVYKQYGVKSSEDVQNWDAVNRMVGSPDKVVEWEDMKLMLPNVLVNSNSGSTAARQIWNTKVGARGVMSSEQLASLPLEAIWTIQRVADECPEDANAIIEPLNTKKPRSKTMSTSSMRTDLEESAFQNTASEQQRILQSFLFDQARQRKEEAEERKRKEEREAEQRKEEMELRRLEMEERRQEREDRKLELELQKMKIENEAEEKRREAEERRAERSNMATLLKAICEKTESPVKKDLPKPQEDRPQGYRPEINSNGTENGENLVNNSRPNSQMGYVEQDMEGSPASHRGHREEEEEMDSENEEFWMVPSDCIPVQKLGKDTREAVEKPQPFRGYRDDWMQFKFSFELYLAKMKATSKRMQLMLLRQNMAGNECQILNNKLVSVTEKGINLKMYWDDLNTRFGDAAYFPHELDPKKYLEDFVWDGRRNTFETFCGEVELRARKWCPKMDPKGFVGPFIKNHVPKELLTKILARDTALHRESPWMNSDELIEEVKAIFEEYRNTGQEVPWANTWPYFYSRRDKASVHPIKKRDCMANSRNPGNRPQQSWNRETVYENGYGNGIGFTNQFSGAGSHGNYNGGYNSAGGPNNFNGQQYSNPQNLNRSFRGNTGQFNQNRNFGSQNQYNNQLNGNRNNWSNSGQSNVANSGNGTNASGQTNGSSGQQNQANSQSSSAPATNNTTGANANSSSNGVASNGSQVNYMQGYYMESNDVNDYAMFIDKSQKTPIIDLNKIFSMDVNISGSKAHALLDTGASIVGVSRSLANRLVGIPQSWELRTAQEPRKREIMEKIRKENGGIIPRISTKKSEKPRTLLAANQKSGSPWILTEFLCGITIGVRGKHIKYSPWILEDGTIPYDAILGTPALILLGFNLTLPDGTKYIKTWDAEQAVNNFDPTLGPLHKLERLVHENKETYNRPVEEKKQNFKKRDILRVNFEKEKEKGRLTREHRGHPKNMESNLNANSVERRHINGMASKSMTSNRLNETLPEKRASREYHCIYNRKHKNGSLEKEKANSSRNMPKMNQEKAKNNDVTWAEGNKTTEMKDVVKKDKVMQYAFYVDSNTHLDHKKYSSLCRNMVEQTGNFQSELLDKQRECSFLGEYPNGRTIVDVSNADITLKIKENKERIKEVDRNTDWQEKTRITPRNSWLFENIRGENPGGFPFTSGAQNMREKNPDFHKINFKKLENNRKTVNQIGSDLNRIQEKILKEKSGEYPRIRRKPPKLAEKQFKPRKHKNGKFSMDFKNSDTVDLSETRHGDVAKSKGNSQIQMRRVKNGYKRAKWEYHRYRNTGMFRDIDTSAGVHGWDSIQKRESEEEEILGEDFTPKRPVGIRVFEEIPRDGI